MQYKTSVRPSKYGLGLFADEQIPPGVWWKANDANVVKVNRSLYHTMQQFAKLNLDYKNLVDALAVYSFYDKAGDELVIILDNSRFINHSEQPNSNGTADGSTALRTIEPDDEIVENYCKYDVYPWPETWDEYGEATMIKEEVRKAYVKTHPDNPLTGSFLEYCEIINSRLYATKAFKTGEKMWDNSGPFSHFVISATAWQTFESSHWKASQCSKLFHDCFAKIAVYNEKRDCYIVDYNFTAFAPLASKPNNVKYDKHNNVVAATSIEVGDEIVFKKTL